MQRKKPDVDVIMDILRDFRKAFPESGYIIALMNSYIERGFLTRKQMEELYNKAKEVNALPVNRLATLEAEIKKRPERFRTAPPPPAPLYSRDEKTGKMISDILEKFPQHKRVLFLKTKYDNNEPLSPAEITELEKFVRMLLK